MDIQKFGEFLPGCVIALNGLRKYAYIYKPNIENNAADQRRQNPEISADFIGFESSDDDAGDSYGHMERQKAKKAALKLRRELPRWLERLFDGMLRDKKRLEKWPRMEKPWEVYICIILSVSFIRYN